MLWFTKSNPFVFVAGPACRNARLRPSLKGQKFTSSTRKSVTSARDISRSSSAPRSVAWPRACQTLILPRNANENPAFRPMGARLKRGYPDAEKILRLPRKTVPNFKISGTFSTTRLFVAGGGDPDPSSVLIGHRCPVTLQ